MKALFYICGGCLIPIITIGIIAISEWVKFFKSWDGRYTGVPWITIWRAERAYKRGDIKRYNQILGIID